MRTRWLLSSALALVLGVVATQPAAARRIRLTCTDGDPSCDADHACDGGCTFLACVDSACSQTAGVLGVLSGSYACSPGTLTCAESVGAISGTVVGSTIYPVVSFADGYYCNFGGLIVGLVASGKYACHDPSGIVTVDYGQWSASRCP